MLPPRRELDGVREQVEDDLAEAPLVAGHQVDVRCELERELNAVLDRAFAHHHDAAFERLAQREAGELELDLPGLDLRQVEHVVDQREQMVARGEDVVEVLLLLLVDLAEHPLPQHLREADDRVQRGAQLVRHARQELALVPARRLELPVQPVQLVVHAVDVRRERAELVAVRNIEPAGEIALGDLRKPASVRWIGPTSAHESTRPSPRASATLTALTVMIRLREDEYALRLAAISEADCSVVRLASSS